MNAPRVEIVAIGDELMLGDTFDTNGGWLGQRLAEEGIRVVRRTVVGDDEAAIRSAINDALARTHAVICCGGLGPTPDDRTRAVVADLYGWPLEVDEHWLDVIRGRFSARGITMPAINVKQAEVPRGAILLTNDVGTAPGLLLDSPDLGLTILLPGVPRELRWLTEQHVIPALHARLPRGVPVRKEVLRVTGISESALAERIADIEASLAPLSVAYLPNGTGIDIRITAWGDVPAETAADALREAAGKLRERLGRLVYGHAGADLAVLVGEALRRRGWKLAAAESCTGGLLAKRMTDVPGSSDYFLGGVVSYANEIKRDFLGVPQETIDQHGAVSEAVATAMLAGIRRVLHADCGVSITGVAGPGGGSPEKPVGTVWIGTATPEREKVKLLRLFGARDEIRERSVQAALKQLFDQLSDEEP